MSKLIKLDLENNEIVMECHSSTLTRELNNALGAIKGMKTRVYKNKIFVNVAFVDDIKYALIDYKGMFEQTKKYDRLRDFLKEEEIIIDVHPSYAHIKGGRLPFKDIIPNTSYFDKKFLHVRAYKEGRISGMVHLFDIEKGRFPSGLLEKVIEALNKNMIPFTVNRHFEYPESYLSFNPKFPFEPTEDQVLAVEALDKANNGIGKLPTGFGKTSYVSVALIAKKGVRTMFLANQRILINDAKSDFEEAFGIEIGVIGDGEFNPQDLTVASIQGVIAALQPPTQSETKQAKQELKLAMMRSEYDSENVELKKTVKKCQTRLKKIEERVKRHQNILEYLKTVDMFIIDEGQVIGTSMWDKFFDACPAPYRYTVTATDTRTDGGRIEIIAATGERRFESSADEQIQKGRLSDFRGNFKKFDHAINKDILKSMNISYHQAYDTFIVRNEKRNSYLCDWLQKWKQEGYSILALVTRKEHGEIVQDMLTARGMVAGKDFEYVDGETKKSERQSIIERFRNSEFPILIGTSIFDVGFNAKNASKMVRFNAGSSEVREAQRSGRTVRKRDDGTIGETIDIIDLNVPYFQSQGWKRYEMLAAEFGKTRANILDGVIKAPTELATLREVANEMPEEMDKVTLLNALQSFTESKEVMEQIEAEPQMSIDDLIGNDDDLKDFAADLSNFIDPSLLE